jgi:ATP-binding protein involved in chromosome partitioning
MPHSLHERIAKALSQVHNPRTGADVLSADMVRDVGTTTSGRVRLTLLLAAADDPALAREVRRAVERVDGVTDVRVDVRDPAELKPSGPPASRALPVIDTRAGAQRGPASAGMRPAPEPKPYPHLGHIIAISSGKGGVGKSTVATNLAVALAQRGARVGLMDADVYGPNVPRMMGLSGPPSVVRQASTGRDLIVPHEAYGVKVISLGFLIERDQPAIWRGPIVMKIVTQFLQDVAWGQLDFFVVDMPPGTGDAQLSLVQATNVHGVLIVTTPQEVSVGDALRGVKMFQRVNTPVLGIVENMSWFECPHCGKPSALFGSGGGERLAREVELPLLAQIPLYPRVLEAADQGTPIVVADAASPAARALSALAERVADAMHAVAV